MSRVFVVVHMAWATRARSPVLDPQKDAVVKAVLNEAARREHSTLLAVGIAWDHVHVIAQQSPRTSTSALAQRLKGFSAHELNARLIFPRGVWWQVGYFAQSISEVDVASAVAYVRNQRVHHDASHPMEHWLIESPTKSDFTEG